MAFHTLYKGELIYAEKFQSLSEQSQVPSLNRPICPERNWTKLNTGSLKSNSLVH